MSASSFASRACALATVLLAGAATLQGGDGSGPHAPAPVGDTLAVDPIARLQARLESGDATLEADTLHGYLPALLSALRIPTSSQGLVFSRTSLQTDKIAPWAPRAIYFNDDVYVAYVQGSDFLEIAAVDPDEGAVFYTMGQMPGEPPRFHRESNACLMCHTSRTVTEGVPGLIVLSTMSDRLGYPIASMHDGSTSDRTPYDERWGGWYVTGTHEGVQHSGNTYSPLGHDEVRDPDRHRSAYDAKAGGNLVDLEAKFHTGAYLTPHSDIVALMVLTHQARVHNLITAVHEQAAEAFRLEPDLREAGTGAEDAPRSAGMLRIVGAADRLVDAMLFAGEAPLGGAVRGTSGFAEEFAAPGPRDSRGRSLRDLDLQSRLFRYPLSFLIYSEAFDAMPEIARREVYRRLWEVLSVPTDEEFPHLSAEDRRAILEILQETKPEFSTLRGDD